MPRSKTDQSGEGLIRAIPYGDGPWCPAKGLRAWLNATGIVCGHVFRSISRWGVIGADKLNAAPVNSILADAAELAQLDY